MYAYCYYKERSQQSMPNFLGGLLKQLLQARNSVPENVKALYEKHRGGYSRTTQIELSSLLRVELRRYRKAFIIIDALDEYSESDNERDSLLAEPQALKSVTDMMLTSRIVSPFVDAFQSAIRVPITANNRRFLERQIPTLAKCVKSSLGLQELIVHIITELVEGIYVLSDLSTICSCSCWPRRYAGSSHPAPSMLYTQLGIWLGAGARCYRGTLLIQFPIVE